MASPVVTRRERDLEPPQRPAASPSAAAAIPPYAPPRGGTGHYPPMLRDRGDGEATHRAGVRPAASAPVQRPVFGMPNLRRNVCPHFYMTGSRGAIPIHAPHLLKALSRQDVNVSRCQLRGGVHLEQGYVADVCLSARFNQCVFYEDELARR